MGPDRLRSVDGQRLRGRLQNGPLLQGLVRIGGIGAEQQPARGQFGRQQGDAALLIQPTIVRLDARHLEQVGDHPLVHIGVLAQVQRRHVEAEDVHGGD